MFLGNVTGGEAINFLFYLGFFIVILRLIIMYSPAIAIYIAISYKIKTISALDGNKSSLLVLVPALRWLWLFKRTNRCVLLKMGFLLVYLIHIGYFIGKAYTVCTTSGNLLTGYSLYYYFYYLFISFVTFFVLCYLYDKCKKIDINKQ